MKIFIIIFTVFLFATDSTAQRTIYISTRDYQLADNLDSLEKLTENYKNEPYEYLHSLITLERNRRYLQSAQYGNDFTKIFSLATALKSDLGLSQYYYLKGYHHYLRGERVDAFTNYMKVIPLVEKINDSTGRVTIYKALLDFYRDSEPDKARFYLKKVKELSQKSSSSLDKLIYLVTIMTRNKLLDTLRDSKGLVKAFNESIEIINNNPQLEPQRKTMYSCIQFGLQNLNENKLALNYAREGLTYNQKRGNHHYIDYFNFGFALGSVEKYDEAIIYVKKAIDIFNKTKSDSWGYVYLHYNYLHKIQYKTKRYKDAYETSLSKDSIREIMNERHQKIALAELETKYETEKKEVKIKSLEFEKRITENQNWLIIGILILAILGLSVVSYLAVKLKKSNNKLNLLNKERDKLFTIIAHDLRGPINTFQNLSDIMNLLLKNKQFDKIEMLVRQIEILGLNLGLLLNNLLNWSLTLQAKVQTQATIINTKTYFDELLPIYKKMAELKSITWNETLIETNIKLDINSFSVIIRNLLDNAIKNSSSGELIEIITTESQNNYIFQITNSRKKLTNAQFSKIKELLEGTKEYTFGEDGLGIGMILIKQYADVCHAKINIDVNESDRVCFRMQLPNTIN